MPLGECCSRDSYSVVLAAGHKSRSRGAESLGKTRARSDMLKMAPGQEARAVMLAKVQDGSEEFFRQYQTSSEIRSQMKGSIFLLSSGQERPSAAIAWRAAWPRVTIYLWGPAGQCREQAEGLLITALRQLVQPGLAQANQDLQSPSPMGSFSFSLGLRPLYSTPLCLGRLVLNLKFPPVVPKAPSAPGMDVRGFSASRCAHFSPGPALRAGPGVRRTEHHLRPKRKEAVETSEITANHILTQWGFFYYN